MGRQGNTDTLNLEAVGLQADKRGLLDVNSYYQVRPLFPWLVWSRSAAVC
jgi:pyruvate/2-oxoglutarate dehydrogenase complex dihydrolipoamide dehydrogenase (E3) component